MDAIRPGSVLSTRALNRALLARQLLLRRSPLTPLQALEHLVGLQAQAPNPPYLGLWSRLERFRFDDLAEAVVERRAVRLTLMRGTVHLVSARDALALRPVVQQALVRQVDTAFARKVAGVDRAELIAEGRELLNGEPVVFSELGRLLQRRWPQHAASALANVLRAEVPLVHVPPRGVWGRGGRTTHTTVESWLGRPVDARPDPESMLRRYLAAFGPATVADLRTWSGVPGWGPVVERLRPELVGYRDPQGRELLDLPGAPLPDPETPAPVRLTAEFDNLTLSHADRSRVICEDHRKRQQTRNGIVPGALLVDGFVAGQWRLDTARRAATVTIDPYTGLSSADRSAAGAEAARLLAAVAPEGVAHEVRINSAE
ncbi:winged helix DNA-binding domain-containing protein [Streptantibioticus ferralitis]|uniref:Winged helix DNA-binding domain-containing protein n=1 Tax=Streptantibioticus ferralitis TaxID=236510 RepID=A0ABT5Z6Y7_9ACTN|nr:winged helix DNA-binding domain-containing protein [Streptantibioticus ferralitis]MDF2259598.1 winged helix DNA-binding domain-containing protein [Streptantibioticus ferralitis]